MDAVVLLLLSTDTLWGFVADAIRFVWVLVTVVSVISLVVIVSHLVPRKEY